MIIAAAALALSLSADTTRAKPRDPWLSADKFQHAGMSYAITSFAFAGTNHKSAAIASAGTAAIMKEIYDLKKRKHFSGKDLVWDAIGIAIGYTVIKNLK